MDQPQKYRKKPVVIEAIQFGYRPDGTTNSGDVSTFIRSGHSYYPNGVPSGPKAERDGRPAFLIDTLEGELRADVGDWVIKGVAGEFYPCKPDIFELTYESAETVPA
jgi:hypothetical protein